MKVHATFEITAALQKPALDLARADNRNPRNSSSSETRAPIIQTVSLIHGSLALNQGGWMKQALLDPLVGYGHWQSERHDNELEEPNYEVRRTCRSESRLLEAQDLIQRSGFRRASRRRRAPEPLSQFDQSKI